MTEIVAIFFCVVIQDITGVPDDSLDQYGLPKHFESKKIQVIDSPARLLSGYVLTLLYCISRHVCLVSFRSCDGRVGG